MDWLERHWSLVDCKNKIIHFKSNDRSRQELWGIKKPFKLRPIIASYLIKCIQKSCQLYAIQVGFTNTMDKTVMIENIPVVQEFQDVFPK